jgi:uncharacterized membrane protein YhhN
MAIATSNMMGRTTIRASQFLILGAVLFVLSDFLIAMGKFKDIGIPGNIQRVFVMSTYVAAQYFLAKGSVEASENVTRQN